MSNLTQPLPALLGVVVGALASYVVHATSERARWRRTRNERWDVARMEAYVRYGNAIKATTMIATRLAGERGYVPTVERVPLDEGLAELAKAQLDRALLWEEVQLLGHPDTIRAARASTFPATCRRVHGLATRWWRHRRAPRSTPRPERGQAGQRAMGTLGGVH